MKILKTRGDGRPDVVVTDGLPRSCFKEGLIAQLPALRSRNLLAALLGLASAAEPYLRSCSSREYLHPMTEQGKGIKSQVIAALHRTAMLNSPCSRTSPPGWPML